jgi:hypothetical protein
MQLLNKIMLTLTIFMSCLLLGVGIIGIINANMFCSVIGLFFGILMTLIVKHWENN